MDRPAKPAYFALVTQAEGDSGNNLTFYYGYKLPCNIGRRGLQSEPMDDFIALPKSHKRISRRQACIRFDESKSLFEIKCLGTNSMDVDGASPRRGPPGGRD